MAKEKTRRSSFLDKFLGNKGIDKQIEALRAELEKAGIAHKEAGTKQKAVMEKLIEQVRKALQKFIDNPPAELINTVIAEVMGTLAAVDEEDVADEAAQVEGEEEEDEEEDVPEALMELNKEVIRLSEESTDVMKALSELIPTFTDVMKTLRPALPVIASMGDLVARMEKMEEQFKLRPRASKATETMTDDEQAKQDLMDGLKGKEETVWGHKVKPEEQV